VLRRIFLFSHPVQTSTEIYSNEESGAMGRLRIHGEAVRVERAWEKGTRGR
jgi:hypothetical protein